MKMRISDLMDSIEDLPVPVQEQGRFSAENIKRKTLNKIHSSPSKRRFFGRVSRTGLIAAVLAAVFCATAAAAAICWGGFAFTGGMGEEEKDAILWEASQGTVDAEEAADGTVTYFDAEGNAVLTLSPEEAAEYERERSAAADQAVCESTNLVDLSTMPFLPNGVTEVVVGKNGAFADLALGNGHAILLRPEKGDGFLLKAGDQVTLTLTANDICILEFGQFRDGIYDGAETETAREHSYTFSIDENGLYCFYVQYLSAAASNFTTCRLTVH